jgi:hypothetical protein
LGAELDREDIFPCLELGTLIAGLQGKVRSLKQILKRPIPNTQNCYRFMGIMVYPEAETGLVISIGSPRLEVTTTSSRY